MPAPSATPENGTSPIEQPVSNRHRLYTTEELGKFPLPEWLIDKEIPAHALTLLYGASGSGKSFLGLDYASRIARATGRPVVYMAAEGASGYFDRASAWCKHHEYSGDGLLFDVTPLTLYSPEELDSFITILKALKPALVVIDTLARSLMMGLDENKAGDMGLVIGACDAIIRATGAAVLLVHHTGKSGVSERGSSALFAACDCVISLANDDGLLVISCQKSKDSAPFADRYMRLIQVETMDGRNSCVALPSDKVSTRGAALSPAQKKVLDTLALETFAETGAKAAAIQRATGIPDTTLYRVLAALMREGYVRQSVKGDPYFIQQKGIALLKTLAIPALPRESHDSHGSPKPTTPTHSHTSLDVGVVEVDSGMQDGDASLLQNEGVGMEQSQPLPYLDALIAPLHSGQ